MGVPVLKMPASERRYRVHAHTRAIDHAVGDAEIGNFVNGLDPVCQRHVCAAARHHADLPRCIGGWCTCPRHMSMHLSKHLSVRMSIHMSTHMSKRMSKHMSIHLYMHMSRYARHHADLPT